ncbi:hypothetical protein [Variovorax rhizosphaerae]|uniref:Uncharacterized protein n=1 Tax=Variovorax rhizosphaerae TaxID=1836200 RepID=A0ABU8WXX4_9BURK
MQTNASTQHDLFEPRLAELFKFRVNVCQSLLGNETIGVLGQSLDSVRDTLDRWYAAHPDRLQRPVI